MPRSDPTVLLGWSWSRAACSFSARGRRVDRLPWRFCAQRRQRRRRQVCALDATRSRAGMRCVGPCLTALAHPRARATVGCAQRLRLHPPLPLAAGTLARRRLVSILHPGRLCAAGSSRSSTPDALAPQARLDPPPRTRLRRRLVSILHPGRACAAGSSRSSTRVESGLGVGSCPRLALRAAWSSSSARARRPPGLARRPARHLPEPIRPAGHALGSSPTPHVCRPHSAHPVCRVRSARSTRPTRR